MYILFVGFAFEFLVFFFFFLFGKEVNLELNLEACGKWCDFVAVILYYHGSVRAGLALFVNVISPDNLCFNILKVLRLDYIFFILLTRTKFFVNWWVKIKFYAV